MPDISYQNQDLENTNPLHVDLEPPPVKIDKKHPDPKIRLLYILGAVVIVLSVISLIVTLIRKNTIYNSPAKTTPTPMVTPYPTEITNIIKIPADLKVKFDKVDKEIQTDINFPPPQVDQDIGL